MTPPTDIFTLSPDIAEKFGVPTLPAPIDLSLNPFERSPEIVAKYGAGKPFDLGLMVDALQADPFALSPDVEAKYGAPKAAGVLDLSGDPFVQSPEITARYGEPAPLPASAEPVVYPAGETTLTYVTPAVAARFPAKTAA